MTEPVPLSDQSATDEVRKAAEAAAEVFRVRGWTWGRDTSTHRPDADEIEKRLHGLIGNLVLSEDADEGYSSSTGRLHVEWGDEGTLYLSIELGEVPHFFKETADAQQEEPRMNCAGCRTEIAVGDRFIKDRPSAFMGADDDGLDGIMAEVLGGSAGEVAYCEDCTEDGGRWKLETFYGEEDDA